MSDINHLVALSDLNEEFIEEAETIRFADRSQKKLLYRVASVFLVVGIAAAMFLGINRISSKVNSLSVSASELGLEEYTFGSGLPNVIYGDDNIIIMYDFHGIFVYDLGLEKLTGFSDFRPIGMTLIQGDDPTFVEASEDGDYVKFYNKEDKYLYDVKLNATSRVEDYSNIDTSFTRYSAEIIHSGDTHSLSDHFETYKVRDDAYVALFIEHDYVNDGKVVRYKDLRLMREKDGKKQEYIIFQ